MLCILNDWFDGGAGVHKRPPSPYRTFPVRSVRNSVFPNTTWLLLLTLALDEGSLYFQLRFVGNTLNLNEANHFRRDTAYDCNRNADGRLDKHWTIYDIVKGRNYVHGIYLFIFIYGLFDDVVSKLVYVALYDRIICEEQIGKDAEAGYGA